MNRLKIIKKLKVLIIGGDCGKQKTRIKRKLKAIRFHFATTPNEVKRLRLASFDLIIVLPWVGHAATSRLKRCPVRVCRASCFSLFQISKAIAQT